MAWSGQTVAAVAGPRLSEWLGRTASEARRAWRLAHSPSGLCEAGNRRRGRAVPKRSGATAAPADKLTEIASMASRTP